MITGAHVVIHSTNTEADAAFLRDVLAFPYVDAGGGRLMFAMPPAECAMHEADGKPGSHELFWICDDVHKFVEAMTERSIACDPIVDHGWGVVSGVALPSGIKVSVYEPHHARPASAGGAARAAEKAAKKVKKAAKALRKSAKEVRKATKKATKVAKKAKKKQ